MIDSHCHMDSVEFDYNRKEVIARAAVMGIAMICSAITPNKWDRCLKLARENNSIFMAAGLDPIEHAHVHAAIAWIIGNHEELVGIGEVGLDHYLVRDHNERNLQEQTFRQMIEIAGEVKLPLQIHSRSAGKHALKVLEDANATDVQMHAFDGKANLARIASHELGYYFSIPTSVIRSPQKKKLVKAVEIEHLLIETDSPVLGPDRGVSNTPVNLPIALKEVASILQREEEEIREITLENTLRLYTKIKRIDMTDR
jgi:TatD DNase family protein